MTTETIRALDELDRADALLALLTELRDGELPEAARLGMEHVLDDAREHLAAAREAVSWVHELHRLDAGAEPAGGA